MALGTIPPEIWTEVFAFSCTDDGCTGRALSLVSRAAHLVSKPLKYQSIVVTGFHELLKLLAVLCELPPGERRVKYLFVGGLDDSKDFEDPDRRAELQRRLDGDPNAVDIAEKTLGQILRLVAPSLVALHIHCTTISRPSLFPEIEFPLLAELTLHGPFQSLLPTSLRPLSSLRRVQIHHLSYHPANFLQQIVHTAPSLTHLRVPQGSFTPYAIQVALGILQPVASDPEAVRLPENLKELVVELDTARCADGSAGNIRANQFLRKFRKIADGDSRVRLVDGRSDWMGVDEAKREWLGEI
ncbi:hypothetical protein DFH08DRAFT_774426 [Mycena albidolilacea]|uniref:Uncharacterized protein n=1 Tax=Mycena albidolilacea TaxID=1033008 RepID=A0AAD7EWB0_9AGAR|nr:hypothetical protein DFH08DRAFT_774426 [Mycena albidolilacea]